MDGNKATSLFESDQWVPGRTLTEYTLGRTFKTNVQAKRAIDEAVLLYNTRRSHLSLNKIQKEVNKIIENVA
jgi:transposase InsO family protein